MAWIPIHQSLLTHRKTLALCDKFDLPEVYIVGHLTALWCWAMDNAPEGILPDSVRIIAKAAQWPGVANDFVSALLEVGYLEYNGDLRIIIHEWDQYGGKVVDHRKHNAERQKAHRERHKDEPKISRNSNRNSTQNSKENTRNGDVTVTSQKHNSPEERREEETREELTINNSSSLSERETNTRETSHSLQKDSSYQIFASRDPVTDVVVQLWGIDRKQPTRKHQQQAPAVIRFFQQANAPPELIRQFYETAFSRGLPPHLSQVVELFPQWQQRQTQANLNGNHNGTYNGTTQRPLTKSERLRAINEQGRILENHVAGLRSSQDAEKGLPALPQHTDTRP